MNITQVRKASEKLATNISRLYDILEDVNELVDIIGEMEELQSAIEENLDKIYEADNPTETQQERQDQYESLKDFIDELLPTLTTIRDGIEELKEKGEELEQVIPY
jgi:methyl-accepting chemotaxis protein